MKLRQKFLILTAFLLMLVLGGSFYFIFNDLRREFVRGFENDLVTSVAAFRSQEARRFQTLQVMAGFLESSPSFRSVLRRSDYQTIQEYLKDVNGDAEVTLIILTDAGGKLLNRTDSDGEKGTDLSNEGPVALASQGQYVNDYWLSDKKLYQVASIPLVDSQDFVDGTLTLGFELDRKFLGELKKELGADVAFSDRDWSVHTNVDILSSQNQDYLTQTVNVGGEGTSQAHLTVGKSLRPMHLFVEKAQRNLLVLGGSALLVALLISIPLIGKMTDPVRMLEAAKAEMETIFTSNLDGLLATDENGLVTTCNPAATVALGHRAELLVGSPLSRYLPEGVQEQLQMHSGGSTEAATFTRQGRDFRVKRTYVKLDSSDLLGSILLFHDVTEEKKAERLLQQFVNQIRSMTPSDSAPPEFTLALTNLQYWGQLNQHNLVPNLESCETDSAPVLADPQWLSLCLRNLEAFAHSQGNREAEVLASENGGSVDFQIQIPNPEIIDSLGEDPLRSALGPQGLALFVTSELVRRLESHLKLDREKKTISFSLPKAVDV